MQLVDKMKNRNGYIGVNGSEIYYELSGNPEGEPLLMLHGGLGSLNELSPIHKYVAADYQLISIDFRGHGKSLLGGLPLNYMQYQQDVRMFLVTWVLRNTQFLVSVTVASWVID